MKAQQRMKILLILVALLAIGVFTAQQLLLPQLREQVAMGLKSGLNDIGNQIAKSLNHAYEEKLDIEMAFIQEIRLEKGIEHTLIDLREIAQTKRDSSMLTRLVSIILPDSTTSAWHNYDIAHWHKSDRWIKEQTEPSFLVKNLEANYQHWSPEAHLFWQNRIDSTLILFGKTNAFRPAAQYIYEPIFIDERLLAFACFYVDDYYVEEEFIPEFFTNQFWPKGYVREDGIKREFLDIRMRNEKNDLIYFSQALYRGSGEISIPLSQSGMYMSQYVVDLGFFSKTAKEVAASLHQRNVWLVNAVFLSFLIMLFFIYRTYRKSLQLDQLKVDFMANISHELKSPLAAIRMANDTLRLERIRNQREGKKISGIIQDEVIRLEKLVLKLLDFSQLEAGERIYQKEEIILTSWWQVWSEKAWEKMHLLGFDLHLPHQIPQGSLYADPIVLEEVLEILLDNAMKYSIDDRKIIIHTETTKDFWLFSVQDFGIGISARDQKQIFEKFRRIEGTQTHNVKGYGLGLSIAKAMLESHGGKISVRSQLGEGSIFMIEIPTISSPS